MSGAELVEALATIGWSQRELARRVGVSESRVRRWVAGKSAMPLDLVAWLAKASVWHERHPPPRCGEAKAAAED